MECGIYLTTPPPQPDNIVLCSVRDERALLAEAGRLTALDIPHRVITEPDMNNQATAIATAPLVSTARGPLRALPLWKPQHALDPQRVSPAPHAGLGGAIPSRSATHAPVA